jgi:glycogen debranching enzyme
LRIAHQQSAQEEKHHSCAQDKNVNPEYPVPIVGSLWPALGIIFRRGLHSRLDIKRCWKFNLRSLFAEHVDRLSLGIFSDAIGGAVCRN